MMELVKTNIFKDYPNIKIIIHHAEAMIPFFKGRIDNILPEYKENFKKFYVDTAILGNSKALELAIDYFGIDKILYGTDAPFGIMPNGAIKEIESTINELPISDEDKEKIFYKNNGYKYVKSKKILFAYFLLYLQSSTNFANKMCYIRSENTKKKYIYHK